MDVKCVRVLRPYDEAPQSGPLTIHIDEDARHALNRGWGAAVQALGRREATLIIAPLQAMDQQGYIARAGQAVIDALFIEYGEEVILQ
ncbi:MAG: hypothetical protein LBP33_11125 [Candidatus Adiutrix sp.]|jgi:hypothetical protein|nr:hypothetical protein [Candidatus Adiutrix sp.]